MPLLHFDLIGFKGVQQSLVSLETTLNDVTAFWTEVFAPTYFAAIQDLFNTSGTPRGEGGKFSGAPWAALTPIYAQWKYKVYPGAPILTATGTLRNSLAWGGAGLGPGGIFEATPHYVRFGTSVPYAAAHQYGSPKRNLPARTFLIKPDPQVFGPLLKQWLLTASGWKGGAVGGPGAGLL